MKIEPAMKQEAHIRLDGLNWDILDNWLKKSEAEEGYVNRFISLWIAFNHYYATYWVSNNLSLIQRRRSKEQRVVIPDKKGIDELRDNPMVQQIYESLSDSLDAVVELPIEDDITGEKVPSDKSGGTRAGELSIQDFFDVIYKIRNNLFHGRKDPGKFERDRELCEFAYKALSPVFKEILERTYPKATLSVRNNS